MEKRIVYGQKAKGPGTFPTLDGRVLEAKVETPSTRILLMSAHLAQES